MRSIVAITDEQDYGHRAILPTLPAGRGQRKLALAVALTAVVIFLCVAPFAKTPLATVAAFIPIYESALIAIAIVTAALLVGQYTFLRSRELLVLACAYLFAALMTTAHALAFPGLFSPTGLLGGGPQSAPWLYLIWHGGFPLFIIVYVLVKRLGSLPTESGANIRPGALAFAGMVMVAAMACGLTWLATTNQFTLPDIMQGDRHTPAMTVMVASIWLASLLALAMLWQRRPHSAIDVWLMVVMCGWLLDLALSVGLNTGRFDLGFYAGRLFGLLAAGFLLAMLLIESSMLHAGLIEVYDRERRERRRIQKRTEELEAANKYLEEVSRAVSHDLRAPLRVMDGFAKMLEEGHGARLDAEGRRFLAVIRANNQKMEHVVETLLSFSRLGREPFEPELIQLDKLVRDVTDHLRSGAGNRDIKVIADKLGQTRADPGLLKQALTYLIGNAFKFTSNQPTAVIEIGRTIPATGEAVIYHVKDNGAGFDMRYADRLYGLFQRLHSTEEFEGDGVGLAIVQRIIERHGGRIWADSKPGSGTSFYFTLQSSLVARNAAGSDDY